jgi:hypothetical protein
MTVNLGWLYMKEEAGDHGLGTLQIALWKPNPKDRTANGSPLKPSPDPFG